MKSDKLEVSFKDLVASQWGMITTAQAGRAGISRSTLSRMVGNGKLERVFRGVYRSTNVPVDSKEGLYAAWLALSPSRTGDERIFSESYDSVVSLETAAWLHGLGDFVPEPYRFSITDRKQVNSNEVRLKIKKYPKESLTICAGLPTTTVEQTVADLVEDHTDFSLIQDMFLNAPMEVIQNLDFDYMAKLLSPLAKRNGFKTNDGQALCLEILHPLQDKWAKVITDVVDRSQQRVASLIQEELLKNASMIGESLFSPHLLKNISTLSTDKIFGKTSSKDGHLPETNKDK
ncbi:type IV toxin-antitoxin system AbiEi family antitoxin domain-containing protein [Bifidobacterium sp. ESL0728]|uniref:type IV toxin-antitoxin system AbiEi family antitoxin domain-containing protein n=1 Tax=Bifidobacterium sp. ESL0728 TaxID=2983220 RepID=UPI0023F8990B|nr:type IV toxin-antitoxin system AbiEi family antitoxin domain-containing protein [Bifidobacterium sp. ESL0728]WEV59545.1 type IV toxin-antitoxin system AbiEi family antitoxin domain-containing protein [Bifidobacterium sp. ESL0728]